MSCQDFKKIETADGSPSLEWLSTGEAMHNRQGAFSESVALYGAAVRHSLEKHKKAYVLSMGLGLGYNELITLAFCLASDIKDIYMESFEIHPLLQSQWLQWLEGESLKDKSSDIAINKNCTSQLAEIYHQIAWRCENHFHLKKNILRFHLQKLAAEKRWLLREGLDESTEFSQKFHCILYDPFSAKTNPECWSESYITSFLEKACLPDCLLVTYAAKGTLKRSLKKQGFVVNNPEGFGGKRQCTFAERSSLQIREDH